MDDSTTQASIEAHANIPPNLALIKVENETMMAAAVARERNLDKIGKNLVSQIRTFPDFAETVVYARPVGKDESGKPVIATGLSIRAAEAIAEAYGFNRVWSEIELLPSGDARVSASFTDFQGGRVISRSVTVSRVYKTKAGKMVSHAQDRFLDVVCKAAQSKLVRDCILASVPPSLKVSMEMSAKQAVRIGPKVVDAIMGYFGGLGVEPGQIETFLGAPRDAWSDYHRARLQEVRIAIEQEGVAPEEFFGMLRVKTEEKQEEKPKASSVENALEDPQESGE